MYPILLNNKIMQQRDYSRIQVCAVYLCMPEPWNARHKYNAVDHGPLDVFDESICDDEKPNDCQPECGIHHAMPGAHNCAGHRSSCHLVQEWINHSEVSQSVGQSVSLVSRHSTCGIMHDIRLLIMDYKVGTETKQICTRYMRYCLSLRNGHNLI